MRDLDLPKGSDDNDFGRTLAETALKHTDVRDDSANEAG
jgi:hypothetical protein